MEQNRSVESVPDLTTLPRWAAIAVATRHVLRQATLFEYFEASQIRALDLCTTYAALASIKQDAINLRLGQALSSLAGSLVRENDLLIAAEFLALLPINETQNYERIVSPRGRNPYPLATELQNDYEAAREFSEGFFLRPLLASPDEELEKWLARTGTMEADFADRFLRQVNGRGIDFEEAEQRLQQWAAENLHERRSDPADSRMLSDDPVDEAGDRLDFKPYANAIARLINNPKTKTPLVLAINAPWGAGKSTLARMIESRLYKLPAFGRTRPHVICWFNAWMHDDAPNLAAAFAAEITRTAGRRRPAWRRIVQPLPSALLGADERVRRRTWISAALLAGFLPFLFTLVQRLRATGVDGNILDPAIAAVIAQNSWPGLILVAMVGLSKVWTAVSPLLNFVSDPAKAAASGSMNKVREQLGMLIRQATSGGNRFIIFVDDIERCQAPRSIDVLEVVNQLLGHENVVTVLMADIPAVAACAQIKYEKLAAMYVPSGYTGAPGGPSYGRAYLQKIIQLQFDMPAHQPAKMQQLVEELAKTDADEKENGKSKSEPKAKPTARGGPITSHWVQGFNIRRDLLDACRNAVPGTGLISVLVRLATILPHWCIAKADGWGYPRPAGWPSFWPKRRWFVFSCVLDGLCVAFFLGLLSPLLWIYRGLEFRALQAVIVADALFVIVLLISAVAWVRSRGQQLRDAEILAKTDRLLSQQREHSGQNFSQVLEQVQRHVGIEINEEIIREQMQLVIADQSQMRRDAEEEIIAFLPPLPRNAKRIINRLRLFLLIASERKMFEGDAGINSRQMAKWAVLCEKWPELAHAVAVRPALMQELEEDARNGNSIPSARLQKVAPSCVGDEELHRFCSVGARIGNVAGQLIQFESAGSAKI